MPNHFSNKFVSIYPPPPPPFFSFGLVRVRVVFGVVDGVAMQALRMMRLKVRPHE